MSYLQDINRHEGANTAGIVELLVANVASVSSISRAIDGVVSDAIVFNTGFDFVKWFATSESLNAMASPVRGADGNFKRARLPFLLPKDTPAVRAQLERAENDEFIVLYRDANNNLKLFGTLDDPVQFKFTYDTGRSHGSKNGYACEFYYEGPENIFFYTGSIGGGGSSLLAPVVVEWNDGTSVQTIAVVPAGGVLRINSKFDYDSFEIDPEIS